MTEHAVVIAGGGPAGMMLAAELALAKVDVAVVERRPDHVLAGSRAGGFHSRTIEVLAQVVNGTSSESLLDTYHDERHPVGARTLKHTMAQAALQRRDDRMQALVDVVSELASMDEPRKRLAGTVSGLDIRYDLGKGHPLFGRRMPDLDLITAGGPLRVFELLHEARPLLLDLGQPGDLDITPWADRVQLIDAEYAGPWDLPVLGAVSAPTAVLIRPDGYVAWVGDGTHRGLADALATWFGPPTAA